MTLAAQTDSSLLRYYADSSDAGAFAELVRRHADMVYATARRVTGDSAAAEDVSQDCFLRLAHCSNARINGSIAAWLHRTTLNRSLELLRSERSRRLRELRSVADEASAGSSEHDDITRLIARVDQALTELPEDQRTLITEHFLCGRSQTELAGELGLNQSTVQRRIEKGLDRLRRRLRDEDSPSAAAGLPMLLAGFRRISAPEGLRQSLIKIGLSGVGDGAVANAAATTATTSAAPKLLGALAALVLMIAGAVVLVSAIRPSAPTNNSAAGAVTTMTFDQLPPPVRKTVEATTPVQFIREIEQKRDLGKTVYDIDYAVGVRMYEIRVAEDGTLIWKKAST